MSQKTQAFKNETFWNSLWFFVGGFILFLKVSAVVVGFVPFLNPTFIEISFCWTMFLSKSSSTNYQMPTSLKTKLEYARRNFSSNKPPAFYETIETKTPRNSPIYLNYSYSTPKRYNTNISKFGYEKMSKREENDKKDLMNQKFDAIEAALQKAKKNRMEREREYSLATNLKDNKMDPLEIQLRRAHMINYIDQVLSEEAKLILN